MNFKETLFEIYDFLTPYEDIWNNEILHHYPSILNSYCDKFIDPLSNLSNKELWQIDARQDFTPIKNTPLFDLLNKAMSFNQIIQKHIYTNIDLPSLAFSRVKEKKHHELDNLIPLIKNAKIKTNSNHVLDIGGGVGHLSRILGCYYQTKSTCIDYNPEFLENGRRHIQRLNHPDKNNIDFLEMDVKKTKISDFNKYTDIFNNGAFMVGLHSCGPLSVKLLRAATHYNVKGIINFGCCYFKCTDTSDNHISSFAKKYPLHVTQEGLTLATRAHTYISQKDFTHKLQVKQFRYGLHLLMYKELGISDFLSVGNTHIKDYFADFGDYAIKKLSHIDIKHNLSLAKINSFYNSKAIQDEIHYMFLCNLIRWFFGRPIELYVLLDRAIYMQESGYQTTLTQYFKEEISPRNIGLLATR